MSPRNRTPDVELIDQETELELAELCRLCGISRELVFEWVEEGLVEPRGRERWRFPGREIGRLRMAGRLQQDFGLETPALPLVLDLLDEIETLRRQVRVLRRMIE